MVNQGLDVIGGTPPSSPTYQDRDAVLGKIIKDAGIRASD